MNSWNFTGNLGKDPELSATPKGTSMLRFSVAVTSGWGENKKTTWVNCVKFGKGCDSLADMLAKGSRVAITGEVTLEEWEAKDGTQQKTLKVMVQDLTLLDKVERKAAPQQAQGQLESRGDGMDDDIPFAPYMRGMEYMA